MLSLPRCKKDPVRFPSFKSKSKHLLSRLLRQGVIEAKTRGSRKQRKEKKNRTKKVTKFITN